MALFGKKKEGGMMDVIRCDEKDYLIWKWSPDGQSSHKENSIRYGSSLRVKDGEVAVFVYKQKDGTMQDYIEGPFDQTIKTANFPILTGITGSAFGGSSPFQAEIYFINLAGIIQLPFWIGRVKVPDPRAPKISVPVSVKGAITFNITDYKSFIKLHRMIDFTLDDLSDQVKAAFIGYLSDTVANAPKRLGLESVENFDTALKSLRTLVEDDVKPALAEDFGINVKRVDISGIEIDKESKEYEILDQFNQQYMATIAEQTKNIQAEQATYRQNVADQQAINAQHYEDSLRVQREETQRSQRLQTESAHLSAHQIDVQGAVGVTAAESLGKLGGSPGSSMGGDGSGGGMNPAAMMTGMAMGGAVGGSMSNMMGNMMQGVNTPQPPPPPASANAKYHISVNGSQAGPYTLDQLQQMMNAGQFDKNTYVWKAGMPEWETAGNMQELAVLFGAVPPPPPSPQSPPAPPAEGQE